MSQPTITIENGKLTIVVDVNDPPVLSKGGKSLLLASSKGFMKTGIKSGGKEVSVAFNAIVSAKEAK